MQPTTLQDYKESITLNPALLHPGEAVDIQLTSQQEYVPLTIEVVLHYLEEEFTVGEGIRVVWDTSGPLKTGRASFIPEKTGSYLIRFGELFRSFSVVDDTYTLCTITLPFANSRYPRGNYLDHYHPEIHNRHLPVDYCVMITNDTSVNPDWALHKTLYAFHVIYGDGIIPFLDGQSLHALDPKRSDNPDLGLRDVSLKEALEIIGALQSRWKDLGYPAPDIIDLCDPGDGFTEAAGQLGIRAIGGLREVTEDGTAGQQFAEVPQLLHDGRMIGFPWQLSYIHEATALIPAVLNPRCYLSPGSGHQDADLYKHIEQALDEQRKGVSVILDGDAPEIIEVNRSILAYLIEKPRTHHNLAFTRLSDLTEFLLRTA